MKKTSFSAVLSSVFLVSASSLFSALPPQEISEKVQEMSAELSSVSPAISSETPGVLSFSSLSSAAAEDARSGGKSLPEPRSTMRAVQKALLEAKPGGHLNIMDEMLSWILEAKTASPDFWAQKLANLAIDPSEHDLYDYAYLVPYELIHRDPDFFLNSNHPDRGSLQDGQVCYMFKDLSCYRQAVGFLGSVSCNLSGQKTKKEAPADSFVFGSFYSQMTVHEKAYFFRNILTSFSHAGDINYSCRKYWDNVRSTLVLPLEFTEKRKEPYALQKQHVQRDASGDEVIPVFVPANADEGHEAYNNFFHLLPPELLEKVIAYFPLKDIFSLAQTCWYFSCLIHGPNLRGALSEKIFRSAFFPGIFRYDVDKTTKLPKIAGRVVCPSDYVFKHPFFFPFSFEDKLFAAGQLGKITAHYMSKTPLIDLPNDQHMRPILQRNDAKKDPFLPVGEVFQKFFHKDNPFQIVLENSPLGIAEWNTACQQNSGLHPYYMVEKVFDNNQRLNLAFLNALFKEASSLEAPLFPEHIHVLVYNLYWEHAAKFPKRFCNLNSNKMQAIMNDLEPLWSVGTKTVRVNQFQLISPDLLEDTENGETDGQD